MPKTSVLTRADEDIAGGRPYLAARRLRTLLAAAPGDVEVYRRLAQAYRQAGDPVEAGRWGFVTGDVTDAELSAFQRAHPSPWVRLRLICWPADQRLAPDPQARERLQALVAEAEESGPPDGYHGPLYFREARTAHPAAWLFLLVVLITGGVTGAYEVFALFHRMLF